MRRKNYGDVKSALARVAGQSGLSSSDARLIATVNEAQERLSTMGEWPWMYERIRFCQYESLVTLPASYEALTSVVLSGSPIPMVDPWFEFVEDGGGPQDSVAEYNVVIPRGEAPVYRQSCGTAQVITVYSDQDERVAGVRPKIRICGIDENANIVRTQSGGVWIDGEEVELRGDHADNYATTTSKFSQVTSVTKARTNGTVTLNYVSAAAVETQAARYQHYDVNPSFRVYHLPNIPKGTTQLIQARVRRRLIDVVSDNDPMTVTNISALKAAVRAVSYGDQGKTAEAEAEFGLARNILNQEANLYKGGQPKQPMTVKMAGGFTPSGIF